MRKTVLVLSINLFCLLAWGQNVQGQRDGRLRPGSIKRDFELERTVSERYRKLMTLLHREAKRKLSIASRELRKEMVKSLEPTDPLKIARTQVNKQFVGLSAAQSDLLIFFVMADLARLGSKLVGGKEESERLDDLPEMDETEKIRLQILMDKSSKLMITMSNMLKKISDTSDAIIQNMK